MTSEPKVLLIEDDQVWIDAVKEKYKDVIVDKGKGFESKLKSNPDVDLVLIDFNLGSHEINGRDILKSISAKNRNVCVGLFSDREYGFPIQDIKSADFFVSKVESIEKADAIESIESHWNQYMTECCKPQIQNEWSPLRTVVVHTPGTELKYVDPENKEFLMEERPDIERSAEEHRAFKLALSQHANARVLDVRDLAVDVFESASSEKRHEIMAALLFNQHEKEIYQHFKKAGGKFPHMASEILAEVAEVSSTDLVDLVFNGWCSSNWPRFRELFLNRNRIPFYPEMNNSYFTRDAGVALNGLFVSTNMTKAVRKRESLLLEAILSNHPWFCNSDLISFASHDNSFRIEGGDVVALKEGTVAVGWSERTSFEAIEKLTRRLFQSGAVDTVLVLRIPKKREFMHLDTVFSMVGSHHAVVYPNALDMDLFTIESGAQSLDSPELRLKQLDVSFIEFLRNELDIEIIETAGGDQALAKVEQVTDATNCFAINNKKVLSYGGNKSTNEAMANSGIEVIEIEGLELVKGRGGPRCMTMPISRWT